MPTAFSFSALHDEIYNGPLKDDLAPFLAPVNDHAVADILNTKHPDWTCRNPEVPLFVLSEWGAANGRREKIEACAASGPPGLKSLGLTAQDMIRVPLLPNATFNIDRPSVGVMMGTLVTYGVLTQDDLTAFMALGDVLGASRAEVLWGHGVVVTPEQVASAR